MESSQDKFNKKLNVETWIDLYNILNKKKYEITNNEILRSQNHIIHKKINELITILEEKLKENCVHELENDYIELDIERYEKICYCTKCMLTF
jgi:hypothetical protein